MRFLKRLLDRMVQRLAVHLSDSLDYPKIAKQVAAVLDYEGIAGRVGESLDYVTLGGRVAESLDYATLGASLDYTTLSSSVVDAINYETLARYSAENLDYERIVNTFVGVSDSVVQKKLEWIQKLQQELTGPIVPWSPLYDARWTQFNRQAMADQALLERFRRHELLAPGYGVGIDERAVEYPWFLVNLQDHPEALLDAGSVLNYDFVVDHPLLRGKSIHILTLGPEPHCFWKKGISYLFGDLRSIPIRDDYYDTVACLSTLEHVGADNVFFTGNDRHREHRPDDFVIVMQELRRVLKAGGALLLTVPYGVYRDFKFQQVFDRQLLNKAIEAFGNAQVTETFYRYTAEGWNLSDAESCADSQYVDWVSDAWLRQEWPNPLPVEPDRAAAARAVACLRLVKG